MFIVEGNIGTGKTTFLKTLQQSLSQAIVTLEAVEYWQNESNGQSILQNFYESPHRWGYTMETIALKIRIQEHIKQQQSLLPNIVERSIYSGYHCFAHNSFEQGYLNNLEWNVYNAWFNFLTSQHCLPPAGFIYLRADPQLSYKRTVQRHRQAEESIALAYLEQIHTKHEDFLIHKRNVHHSILKTPILVLDCNYDLLTNKNKLLDYVEQVQQFIQTHHSCNKPGQQLQISTNL
ncbi:deoxynucleoside kinase [Candidatus Babeliales bacterium]|nr:deoxynucleoside kinase [Candidatus Babeliales bacterium]MBP9844148.1 deoxynucleoside kinase [Candidatus Babeliales bacterium]